MTDKLTPEQVAEEVAVRIVDECKAAAQDLKHLNKCQPGNGYGLKATVLYTQALEWAATMRALLADRASLVAELKSREWRTDWENAPKDGWIAGCNEHGWFKMQWVEGYGWAAYGRLAEPTHFMLITPPTGN